MNNWVVGLNWLDFIFIGLTLLSVLISLIRGFVREIISLFTWIIAFWAAFTFADALADSFRFITSSASMRLIIAFILIFLIIWIAGLIINMIVSKLVHYIHFGIADSLLGGLFGLARAILLVGVIVLLGNITTYAKESDWRHSKIVNILTPYTNSIHRSLRAKAGDKKQAEGVDSDYIKQKLQQLHDHAMGQD